MKLILLILMGLTLGNNALADCKSQVGVAAEALYKASRIVNIRFSNLCSGPGHGITVIRSDKDFITVEVSPGSRGESNRYEARVEYNTGDDCSILSITRIAGKN